MAQKDAQKSCVDLQGTKTILDLHTTKFYFIHSKKLTMPRAKKTNSKPQKPNQPLVITKIVIETIINGRQYFISKLSTSNGSRFIPHYTSDRDDAKDFLSPSMAQQYIEMMHPGHRGLSWSAVDVLFNRHTDPAGDGPNYETAIENVREKLFNNQIPQQS
jgi:hypothetical protein